jgi:hypothetical protein
LFELAAPEFSLVTRLIDAIYPAYERILPSAARGVAVCAQPELLAALQRLEAVADNEAGAPLVTLAWEQGSPLRLSLARQPEAGSDIVPAIGQGEVVRMAFALPTLAAVIAEFAGELRLEIDHSLVIKAGAKLGVLTSCRWNFTTEVTAA